MRDDLNANIGHSWNMAMIDKELVRLPVPYVSLLTRLRRCSST